MIKLHRHKLKYLNKEHSTIEHKKSYFSMMMSSSSDETTTEPVTYVRSVCLKCSQIITQTVPGNVTLSEIIDAGFLEEKK